jgi:phosphoribosylaminoimidazole-succinocarboxamide synthase
MLSPLLESNVPGWPCRHGKVRDVYDLGDHLVIVATDRLSAFDCVLPTGIPDKGRVLTGMTLFWLEHLKIPNHLLSIDLADMPEAFARQDELLRGRTMLVRKAAVVPFECVVRGYLAGSGWKEYQRQGTVCGLPLASGLRECEKLPEPIFTPATKAEEGHDENVSSERMAGQVGSSFADRLRSGSIELYRRASAHAESCGIILADTKFEWGVLPDGTLLLIDEVLTPDSSRFWPRDSYAPGRNPPSFDKQFVRDWLEQSGWDKRSAPPALPANVVAQTRAKYLEAYERLTKQTPLAG